MATLREIKSIADGMWSAILQGIQAEGLSLISPGAAHAGSEESFEQALTQITLSNSVASSILIAAHIDRALRASGGFDDVSVAGRAELQDYFWLLLRWRCSGYPVLNLSESLSAALYLTDVASSSASLWQPPYDPVVVKVPSPSVLRISSSDGLSSREATSILIGSVRGFEKESCAGKVISLGSRTYAQAMMIAAKHDSEATRRWIIRLMPEPMANFAYTFSKRCHPFEDESFGEWARRSDTGVVTTAPEIVTTEDDASSIDNAWRVLMSLWQYLAELTTSASVGSAGDRLAVYREGKGRTYRLGHEIKIDAPHNVLASIGTAGWKVHSRFMVRGHWRNQAVGVGYAECRRTWIKPFWKGPRTIGEVLERAYKVK